MKKLLSIVLAVVMIVGLTSISFAASDRITGAIKPIDSNKSYDLYTEVKPGTILQYPLTADMFSWKSGATGNAKTPVTQSDISGASIQVVTSGSDTSVVKKVSIKQGTSDVVGGQKTAIVEVEFIKPLVSTSTKKFSFNMYLQITRRQQDSLVAMEGEMANSVITVDSGSRSANLGGGKVLDAKSSIKSLDVDLGNNIFLDLNVFNGQKYYGYSDEEVTSDDDAVINKNPSITDVLHLKTINLSRTGKYVDLSLYQGRYVYNEKGAYLGKTSEKLEYSNTYYLSSNDLGSALSGGTSSGNSNTSSNSSTSSNNGTSNSGSTGNTTISGGTSTTSGTVEKADAISLMNTAVAAAKKAGNNTAVVTIRGKAAITTEALSAMSSVASKSNLKSSVQADTSNSDGVIGRLYINPANVKNSSTSIKLGGHVNNANVKSSTSYFTKYFKNDLVVFSLDQDGTFGFPVNVAAKVNLSQMNKNNIYFYSYNRATNKYYRIEKPAAWIDNSGYLRFTTTLAGDIVICDGPLSRK